MRRPALPERWPYHPPPFPDETLESWLQRLAAGLRWSVAGLVSDLIGGSLRELRRSAGAVPTTWLSALSKGTGVSTERLAAFGYPPALNDLAFSWNGHRAGVELTGIPMVCPQCLQDAGAFHLRQGWCLPLSLSCSVHNVLLVEVPRIDLDRHCVLLPVNSEPGNRHWVWSIPQLAPPPSRLADPQSANKDHQHWQRLVDRSVAGAFVDLGWARLPGATFLSAAAGVENFLRNADPSYQALTVSSSRRHPRNGAPLPNEMLEKRRERLLALSARLQSWPEYAATQFGITTPIGRTDIIKALSTKVPVAGSQVPAPVLARLPALFRDPLPEPVIRRGVCVRRCIEQALRVLIIDWPPEKPFGTWTLKQFDRQAMVAQVMEAALSGTLHRRSWCYEDLLGQAGRSRLEKLGPPKRARRRHTSARSERAIGRKRFMAKVQKAVQSRQGLDTSPGSPYQPSPAALERAATVIAAYHYELRDLRGAALRRRLASLAAELAGQTTGEHTDGFR